MFKKLLILIFCISCGNSLSNEQRAQKTINWLEHSFHRYQNPIVESYLFKIIKQLDNAAKNEILKIDPDRLNANWKIHIFESNIPNAFFAGAGNIVLTKNIIKACESEAELASILAHEMSHYYLEHSGEYSLDNEIEADSMALEIIEIAGYRQDASISALNILYRQGIKNVADSQQERTDNLSSLLKGKIIWGINNTREFNKIKRILS